MKYLFLKNEDDKYGPNIEFKYKNIDIKQILENSYGNVIPLICLFKMDVKIIKDSNYSNISFQEYDVIFTKGEIIPKNIIEKYSYVMFVFYTTKHSFIKNNYDISINNFEWSIPHCLISFKNLIQLEKNSIYVDCNINKENLKSKINLQLVYSKDNNENNLLYWNNLSKCRYYINFGNVGIKNGDGFVNSACLNIINIGSCMLNSNFKYIHPFCVCNEENEIISKILKIESNKDLYYQIILFQKEKLIEENLNFKNHIENSVKNKYINKIKSEFNNIKLKKENKVLDIIDNNLCINLPIIPIVNNKFNFDKSIKRVMIDIGMSWNAPNSVKWLNRNHKDSIVIGCEPSNQELFTVKGINRIIFEGYKYHDKWFPEEFKANNFKIDKIQHNLIDKYSENSSCPYIPLKNSSKYYIFPVAINNEYGYSDFNTSGSHSGVGSLFESNHENNGKIKVPVIKLEYILERIPFEYVEFLKIDAQENDNNVILSAGELIKKCAVVSVERVNGEYIGENNMNILEYMKNKNFELIDIKHNCNIFMNNIYKHLNHKLDYDLIN